MWRSTAPGLAPPKKPAKPLQQVFAILRTRTGHDFSRYKPNTVHRRLERRMSVNGIDDIAEYAQFPQGKRARGKGFAEGPSYQRYQFLPRPGSF